MCLKSISSPLWIRVLTFLITRIARSMDRLFTAKHQDRRIKGVDK